MCATDLDLELQLEVAEDEQATGPRPAGGQAPGVAWGRLGPEAEEAQETEDAGAPR